MFTLYLNNYMKKLFYLLLLIPFLSIGQSSTGAQLEAENGFRSIITQTVTNPVYWGTVGADGTLGQMAYYRPAQGDTGVLTFLGLATNSSTTINIGAATGWVQNNESNPALPVATYVNYAGATNVTVTTVGSGVASYVMLDSSGVISFQNTFPTSAERKAKIWLGKVSHPLGSISLVVNEPDYITSPMSLTRDWMQATGPYANNGVYPSANGANLSINISQGTITGDGINFVTDRANPNKITMGPSIAVTFMIRTQTGTGSTTTTITPGVYDAGGTISTIPGSSNQATIQYMWAVPGLGYVVQLGQNIYPTFGAAVLALGKETSFVTYPNLVGNAIPIAALVVTKGCTGLNDTGVTAQFFPANKNGDFFGANAGYSPAVTPKITITTAVSITTATTDANSLGQDGRHVVIDNGVNAINLTCNGGVTTSYGKVGSGAITFVQGSGRTLVQLSGTAVLSGAVGSTATLWSNGTTDYLSITNY